MNSIEEKKYISDVVEKIARECPKRQATSEDERRAHEMIKKEFEKTGLKTTIHSFLFNNNIHQNMVLHFALGVLGTILLPYTPFLSFLLYLLGAISYWGDSTRRFYFLRRLLGFHPSQNVIGMIPSNVETQLRIVFLSHMDAAFTGLVFNPRFLEKTHKNLEKTPYILKRPIEIGVICMLLLGALALIESIFGVWSTSVYYVEWLITLPVFLIALINTEILFRNFIVPGANDDLSGVASLPILAQRLMKEKHPDVEYHFVATGCEEASLGGADALARDMKNTWDQKKTVVIALDGLSMGDLRYLVSEGEVVRKPNPAWLVDLTVKVAATEPRFQEIKPFEIPVGGTDAGAFLAHGYETMALVCVDPKYGAPRFYHCPEDAPENLDIDKIIYSLDFTEKLVREIVKYRLS